MLDRLFTFRRGLGILAPEDRGLILGHARRSIDPIDLTDIEVTPSVFSLHVGETIQLVAEAFDAVGAPMPDVEFSWASTDDSVALVDGGLVTTVGEGSVDIVASAEGVEGRAIATIEAAPADRVEIVDSSPSMEIGEAYQFVAAVYDTNDEEIVGADIVWSSSDDDVLTVSEDGLVTSVGEGDANITATFNGLHDSIQVESSYGLAATVIVTPSSATLDANDLGQFSAQAFNAFGAEIPGVSFQWSSSDPTNVEVDSQGLIQSFGKTSATISASVDGAAGTAQVDVEGDGADVVAKYDQIMDLNPTVPILLRLREYRGQRVPFQDAACTIPVESIGDPIGGVRHPVTGEIVATQSTDASRPVWGGVGVGAVFTGVEFLRVTVAAQISPTSPGAFYAALDRQITAFNAVFGWTTSGSTIGWLLAGTTADRISARVGASGGGNSPGGEFPSGNSVIALANDTSNHTGYVDGVAAVSQSTGSQTPAAGIMPYLGARNDGNDGSEFHFVGSISSALVYDEFHNLATVQNVSGLITLEAA